MTLHCWYMAQTHCVSLSDAKGYLARWMRLDGSWQNVNTWWVGDENRMSHLSPPLLPWFDKNIHLSPILWMYNLWCYAFVATATSMSLLYVFKVVEHVKMTSFLLTKIKKVTRLERWLERLWFIFVSQQPAHTYIITNEKVTQSQSLSKDFAILVFAALNLTTLGCKTIP